MDLFASAFPWHILSGLLALGFIFILFWERRKSRQRAASILKASEAQRASEVKFKTIFEQAPFGIALTHSLTGRFLEVNPRFAEIAGRSMQELTRLTWMDITHPDDVQPDMENMAQVNSGGLASFEMEKRYVRPDDSITWITMAIAPVKSGNQAQPYHLCMIDDISGRKQVEETLRMNEQNYRTLANTGQALIWTSGPDTLCNYFNKIWLEFTGRSMEQELGNGWTEGVHPEDFENCLQTYVGAFDRREAFSMEYRLRRHDGQYIWLQDDGSPRYDPYGNFLGYIGFCLDISERKQAQEVVQQHAATLEQRVEERTADLSRANLELSRALRTRDEFLSSMSHELRTPLTSILGLSESLQSQKYGELNEKQLRTLQTIEGSGRHLLELINDILDLSRIEAGKLDLQLATCSIPDVCEASLQLIKGIAGKKGQSVQYCAPAGMLNIQADGRRLKQALVNLLSNAVKFTPENGELGLEVEPDPAMQVLRLRVWDKGIGIRPEDMGKLFKPFIQLDSSLAREYSGTGLGLSLVQRLTKMHNGSIEVESEFGTGSRFTISMPMPSAESAADLAPLAAAAPRAKLPLVMLADDNEDISLVMTDFLEARACRVMQVRSNTELFERAGEFHPDLLVLDNQLPGMAGLDTLRALREHANPCIAALPVIVLASLVMPGDPALYEKTGAHIYLRRPVNLPALAHTIHTLLDARP